MKEEHCFIFLGLVYLQGLPALDLHILDVSDPEAMVWSALAVGPPRCLAEPSTIFLEPPAPPGRFFHSTFLRRISAREPVAANAAAAHAGHDDGASYEVVVFGGQQYGATLGYLDAWVADVSTAEGTHSVRWFPQELAADGPASSYGDAMDGGGGGATVGGRRGHSTFVLGRKLVVFGGALEGDALADTTVWVYDCDARPRRLASGGGGSGGEGRAVGRWHIPVTTGIAPAPRRGHSARVVDGRLVLNGGYDERGDRLSDRVSHQLAFC